VKPYRKLYEQKPPEEPNDPHFFALKFFAYLIVCFGSFAVIVRSLFH
jgi:hypothetical protein